MDDYSKVLPNTNYDIMEAADAYIARGWRVIPIPPRSKRPVLTGWQNLEISSSDVGRYFPKSGQNIGVILGEKSCGLVDVDLDSPAGIDLATHLLPETGATFGRPSKPSSHWLYISETAIYRKFNYPTLILSKDTDSREQACIAEIRTGDSTKGMQTVFPPSVHESGERIEWSRRGQPTAIQPDVLYKSVSKLAAAALMVKYWSKGRRHETALALSGSLIRNRYSPEEVREFIRAICIVAGDDELGDRLKAVEDTAVSIRIGKNALGLPRLIQLTDEPTVRSFCDWLGIARGFYSRKAESSKLDESFGIVCLRDVRVEQTEWIWKPFIPVGELTIIEGIEGIGKSWLGCALACAVGSGLPLPFHEEQPQEAGNVLMLSAEDSLSHTIKPRLVSMRANLDRIFAIDEVFSLENELDVLRFEALIAENMPRLLIIDPLFSYTGGKNLNQESESRPLARKLIAIAQKYNCAIVGIRHVGKSKGNGDPRSAGLGSIAWRASARSVLLAGLDSESGERAICQTKNNLAEQSEISVGFDVIDGHFLWKPTPSRLTKERMLALPKNEEGRAEQSDAAELLEEILRSGEAKAKEIFREAKQLGITHYALRQAKARLGVKSRKRGGTFGGPIDWFWYRDDEDSVSEHVDIRPIQHLQANGSANLGYINHLTEGVEPPASQHFQLAATADTSSGSGKLKGTCECGMPGDTGWRCRDCGEII